MTLRGRRSSDRRPLFSLGPFRPAATLVPMGEDERTIVDNRRAFYDYTIEDRLEAGIALTGSEIKSIRAGKVNLREGYARIEKGEAWLLGVHISPWSHAGTHYQHEPLRRRKLLLHRAEI